MSDVQPRVMRHCGSSRPKVRAVRREVGMVLQSSEGLSIAHAFKVAFVVSINEAKYEVMLLGLWLVKELSVKQLELRCDSQLVASQLRVEYEAKNRRVEQYLKVA